MGVRLSTQESVCCIYDSVTDQAFGPVFPNEDEAEWFLSWYQDLYGDPRVTWFGTLKGPGEFLDRYGDWYRATHDVDGFRVDIAVQMVRDAQDDR